MISNRKKGVGMNIFKVKLKFFVLFCVFFSYYIDTVCDQIDFLFPPYAQTVGASVMDNISYVRQLCIDITQASDQDRQTRLYSDVVDLLIGKLTQTGLLLSSHQHDLKFLPEDLEDIMQFFDDISVAVDTMFLSEQQKLGLQSTLKNIVASLANIA